MEERGTQVQNVHKHGKNVCINGLTRFRVVIRSDRYDGN